ncbi:MAG: hypothetical protein KDK51_07955 [Deltaproteobacteria bacterium]|nr:hypothetical protein [Deltaproteobacteria bacterium]
MNNIRTYTNILWVIILALQIGCSYENNPWQGASYTGPKKTDTKDDFTLVVPGTLSYNLQTFLENSATNNGSFTDTVLMTLEDDIFTKSNQTLIEGLDYEVSGSPIPAGLSLEIVTTSETQAVIALVGQATSHQASDSVNGVRILFTKDLFDKGVAPSEGNGEIFSIGFEATLTIVYSGTTNFIEKPANNGQVQGALHLALLADTFANQGVLVENTDYVISAGTVPSGLHITLVTASINTAALAITGQASPNNAADSVNGLEITFLPAAFTGNAIPTDGSQSKQLDITLINNPSLSYSGDLFEENAANVGGIDDFVEVSITLDPFAPATGTILSQGTHYQVVSNSMGDSIPNGLNLKIVVTAMDKLKIYFDDQAYLNQLANNVSGLGITFLPALFSGAVPNDGTAQLTYDITFTDNPIFLYEAGIHDGSIGGREDADIFCENNTPPSIARNKIKAFISIAIEDAIADMPALHGVPLTSPILGGFSGQVVANTWPDMLSTGVLSKLSNLGVVQSATSPWQWYSGSNVDGTVDLNNTCDGFTSNQITDTGSVGRIDLNTNPNDWIADASLSCNTQARYLCITFD